MFDAERTEKRVRNGCCGALIGMSGLAPEGAGLQGRRSSCNESLALCHVSIVVLLMYCLFTGYGPETADRTRTLPAGANVAWPSVSTCNVSEARDQKHASRFQAAPLRADLIVARTTSFFHLHGLRFL